MEIALKCLKHARRWLPGGQSGWGTHPLRLGGNRDGRQSERGDRQNTACDSGMSAGHRPLLDLDFQAGGEIAAYHSPIT
jgi:hypothetical protein